jgi:hypothetical protein
MFNIRFNGQIRFCHPRRVQATAKRLRFSALRQWTGRHCTTAYFCDEKKSRTFNSARHWLSDGTFAVALHLFFQLYSVHALYDGQIFTCMYCMLPNKSENTNTRLFATLARFCNKPSPESILVDFKQADMNALSR